jgi:excisionase family DNA binding protein
VTAGERVEHVRRLAAELGLPVDGLDRLAVPPRLAARLLSVSHSHVEKLVARGEMPAFRVGRSVRIELLDLIDFMQRNRRPHKGFRASSTRARAIDLIEGSR